MKLFVPIFIVALVFSSTLYGVERSAIDDYLYGPYYDDPSLMNMTFTKPEVFFKSRRCNKSRIAKLNKEFSEPGLFNVDSSIKNVGNIITCAWQNQELGYVLLEKVVYADQLAQETTSKNIELRQVIYHPLYILQVAKEHPGILSSIPDSHPNYLDIVKEVILHKPQAFEFITLRFKRHPEITQLIFDINSSYDDIYKHYAMQYTMDEDQRKEFVKHNGMLYLELPTELRDNPYLSYYAYVQNDFVYPYIPDRIKKLFKDKNAIKVPRYMTKVVLFRQMLSSKVSELTRPLIESISGAGDDADISIEIEDLSITKNVIEEDVLEELFTDLEFRNELTVVTDERVINKIENRKNRRLLHLWRIARFGEEGQVYVAMFRPHGKDHLGAIVVKQNERLMFSDYAAVFSMDGENIWRINDKGKFNAKSFIVSRVIKHDEGQLKFSFKWEGEYTTNEFNLVDQGGNLLKEFVNYYFE